MSAPLYAGQSRPPELPLCLLLLSRLPLGVLYPLATTGIRVMRRVVRHRVATVRTNIERSFTGLSARERRQIENRYYANLSQVLAEIIKIGGLDREALMRRGTLSKLS